MAMTTRFAARKREENPDPVMQQKLKMVESKLTSKVGIVEDRRRAFGEIHNRREIGTNIEHDGNKNGIEKKGSVAALNNNNGIGAVYKDVKPRVDTRWKKKENVVQKVSSSSSAVAVTGVPISKPLSRQNSIKANDVVKKEKGLYVKSITEKIAMQLKKTTPATSTIDLKKIHKVKKEESSEMGFIRSPASMKTKKNASPKEDSGLKFFESHSTFLLHQIENIDENDKGNPQLLSEYANDIYAYMMRLEKVFPIQQNFLELQMDITPKMRSVLLDWINEVHHQFNLETETFHMAVSMIDRYLKVVSSTPRRFLQLVGVTALFMASKYEELMPPEISDFVYVTDDTYSKQQILEMEMKMFRALEFQLCKPLPIHFVRRFAKAAGSTLGDRQYIAAKYFIELAAIDYELTKYNPSEIAASSIYLALYITNRMKSDDKLWTPTLQFYSTYTVEHLMPIVKRLALIVSTAHEVKLKSIFTKYSHAHFKFTATIAEMTGTKIRDLARS